jgi:outer membrane lipoprotein SlyB
MRTVIALLALATLAGCSTKYDLSGSDWTKASGNTVQDVTYDEMECVRNAREAGGTPDLIVGGLVDVGRYVVEERQRASAYRSCMEAKGYQPNGS